MKFISIMLFIRTLLSPRSRSTQEAYVSDLLSSTGVRGNGELKQQSNSCLIRTLNSSQAPDKFMRALLGKIIQLDSPDELVKLLTLMHSTVCLMDYQGDVLDELSNLRIGCDIKLKGEGNSWFLPFYKAYISYLAKLPSVSEVYLRAKQQGDARIQSQAILEDVFRLINQVNLITDSISGVFNTIGRYYKQKKKIYQPTFDLLWTELLSIYNYLQKAVQTIFKHYQQVKPERLKVFLVSVAQIQLLADKMDEFLMNKYFGREKVQKRLYVFAEEVAKIQYFLNQKGEKNHLSQIPIRS